jgi:protein-S-isoprenylcysteine O-methyltransferase Ste14
MLVNVWNTWPALMHIEEILTLSWRVGIAFVTGGLSLCLALAGLFMLKVNKTTLNTLYPDRTRSLVTRGCFHFSRNPVYLGFVGIQAAAALLLGSIVGLIITPLFILLLTILHIQTEEMGMQSLFGQRWKEYCDNTPRWFSLRALLRSYS